MSDCLLSIITVTLNCAGTIEKTLVSVQAVKQPGIEYIIIDGASTDGTLDIVKRYDSLVNLLVSEPDTGIYNAMNKGVGMAQGRYVLFINGDDALVVDGFPPVMDALARDQGGIICATTVVGDLASPAEILVAKPWRLPFFNSIPHPSSFVRRDLLLRRPFREDLRIVSDYDFFLGAYLTGQSFYVLPLVTALHYRGGASGNLQSSQAELERVRQERLGWRYPLVSGVAAIFRQCKRVVRRRPT